MTLKKQKTRKPKFKKAVLKKASRAFMKKKPRKPGRKSKLSKVKKLIMLAKKGLLRR